MENLKYQYKRGLYVLTLTLLLLLIICLPLFGLNQKKFILPIEILDVGLSFLTFLDLLIYKKSKRKKLILLDLINLIPFSIISIKILPLRALKFFNILNYNSHKKKRTHRNPKKIILLILGILLVAHYLACIWVALGGISKEKDFISQYILSYYWAVTTLTTIGYGDILPQNNIQIIFVIIVELMGAGFYGFIIGNIATVISNLNRPKAEYKEKMAKIRTFLQYKKIPEELQTRILDYYDYLWENKKGYSESIILEELSPPLKTSIALHLNRSVLETVPLFKGASETFIKEIILHLKSLVFTPNDEIVTKGDRGTSMYFIVRGSVDVVSKDHSQVYATLYEGSFFGEIALLLSEPRNATIIAKEYCDCYALDKKSFDIVLKNFPDEAKKIKKLAQERQKDTLNKQKILKS